MTELYLKIELAGDVSKRNPQERVFTPADDDTRARTNKRKLGEFMRGTFRMYRNYNFLKKAHALIKFAFDCQEAYASIDDFREAVTIEAGFFDWKVNLAGESFKVAKSWAFHNMSEDDFSDLYRKMIASMLKYSGTVFNGVDAAVFERQLLNFEGNGL